MREPNQEKIEKLIKEISGLYGEKTNEYSESEGGISGHEITFILANLFGNIFANSMNSVFRGGEISPLRWKAFVLKSQAMLEETMAHVVNDVLLNDEVLKKHNADFDKDNEEISIDINDMKH